MTADSRLASTVSAIIATMLASVACAPAWADIYKCSDEQGLITFTDSPSRKFKACTLLFRDSTSRPPAPGGPAAGSSAGAPPKARPEPSPARSNPGPADFPRVERTQQRERDLKARQVVERELASEQRLLDDARRAAAAADRTDPKSRELLAVVARHERNIAEIQRQLALMK